MQKVETSMIEKPADSGTTALGIFLDSESLDPLVEVQLCEIMAYASDGWTWHLKQRIMRLNDTQWERLIRFLKKAGTVQPPFLWYCRLIAELGADANNPAEANPFKKPGRRLMKELGIRYK